MRAALFVAAVLLAGCFGPPRAVTHPPGVRIDRDLVYAQVAGQSLPFDLYRPEQAAGPLPCVLWIHGGGWIRGTRFPVPIAPLAAKGYAIVAIDYRLAGSASVFPTPLHDAKAAVRFVRANAARLGIDPARIGVLGISAGGHLAALLALTADGPDELQGSEGVTGVAATVACAIACCPPSDLANLDRPGISWKLRYALRQLLGGRPSAQVERTRLATPITHAGPGDPPLLVLHGAADDLVPPAEGRFLHDGAKAAGVDATYIEIPGAGHGNRLMNARAAQMAVEAFFARHLAPPAP